MLTASNTEWDYSLTTTGPAAEPVSIEEARNHCRIYLNDDDDKIAGWVKSAREYCESYLDRQFITATWVLKASEFPQGTMLLPKPPLISVTSIVYLDTAGSTQTLSASNYTVETPSKQPGKVHLAYGQIWPSVYAQANAITVTYVAGYGAATAVPQAIKQAIYLLVADANENREPSTQVLDSVHRLLDSQSWGSAF